MTAVLLYSIALQAVQSRLNSLEGRVGNLDGEATKTVVWLSAESLLYRFLIT